MKSKLIPVLLFGIFCSSFPSHAQQEAELRVGDNILIRMSGVPADESAMFGELSVADDGTINLPWIGVMKAAGLTASELQKAIEAKYVQERIYSNPTVIITGQAAARFVNVGGAVRAPQRVSWTPDLTLMTAINAAGGFNDFANHKRVNLLRGGERRIIDVKEIRQTDEQDVPVQPGDVIEVPMKLF